LHPGALPPAAPRPPAPGNPDSRLGRVEPEHPALEVGCRPARAHPWASRNDGGVHEDRRSAAQLGSLSTAEEAEDAEGAGTHLIPIPCVLRRSAGAHVTSVEKARTKMRRLTFGLVASVVIASVHVAVQEAPTSLQARYVRTAGQGLRRHRPARHSS